MENFKKGDLIVYGTSGVCLVKDTCPSPFSNLGNDSLYYVLEPIGRHDGALIYSPVDNKSVVMRSLMSESEARDFIHSIPGILPVEVDNEKGRKLTYRQTIEACDPAGHVSVIKAVYGRRQKLLKTKKRIPDVDSDYERLAKHCLYSELSASLDIPYDDDVESYITSEAEGIPND